MTDRPRYYKLDGNGNHIACDAVEWARWFKDEDARVIARNHVWDDVLVSTIFLGIDHRFGVGDAVLYETMIFDQSGGRSHELYQERYSTRQEALEGHRKAIAWANIWRRTR